MKYLIAEDEAPQRLALESLLGTLWPEAELCASCESGVEALETAERLRPDAAFLDLRMPGLSGLEVVRALTHPLHVVFVTAYDDSAVAAFERGAIDYLLKPVTRARLAIAIGRLKQRSQQSSKAQLQSLLQQLQSIPTEEPRRAPLQWITATVRDTIRLYGLDEVLAFHAQDKYTRVITRGDEALIRTSLREMTGSIDPDEFWQVHRSVLVRVSAIDAVSRDDAGTHRLTLKGSAEVLPVSSAFFARLRKM